MKKLLLIFTILFATISYLKAENMASIKLGFQAPEVTDAGFVIGFETGRSIDENLDISFSLDWFQKEFTDKDYKQTLEDNNVNVNSFEKEAETTIHSFPLMGNVILKFPLKNKLTLNVTGGVGAEMLIADYNKYVDDPDNNYKDETEFAFGFNWRIGAGVTYKLGSNSDILAELDYHSSTPSFEDDFTDDNGVDHTYEYEYDMSGIMGRVGIRFYF